MTDTMDISSGHSATGMMMKLVLVNVLMLAILLPANAQTGVTRGINRAPGVETVAFGRIGKVTIYRQVPNPSHVVLFVSGDGGWNQGVVDMARKIAAMDALVVGIDITRYLKALAAAKEPCVYVAADLEALSQFIQRRFAFPHYQTPLLVGYSSGATLVYAALVEAPTGTFLGAVSLGFCPDLQLSKPLCRGQGLAWDPDPKRRGVVFLPSSTLQTPWIALLGTMDKVCNPEQTEVFVKSVRNGSIILLPKVGHGFAVPKNWLPQFQQAVASMLEKPGPVRKLDIPEIADLPLVEMPAREQPSDILAVIMSGDGGWAGLDRDIGNQLSSRGTAVVGIDSLRYFWKRRSPEEAASDLQRVLGHYLQAWGKNRVALIGYSIGAEVLPFMADRLPKELLERVQLVAMLGASPTADFEFHLTEWLGIPSGDPSLPVLPEVRKLKGVRILCVQGSEERDSLCRSLSPAEAQVITLKGGHHFGGDYKSIADAILQALRPPFP